MASYHNVEGSEILIQTPFLVNILPIVGFGLTSFFVYRKTKSVGISLGAGAMAGAVCLIPRLVMMKNALNEIKKENDYIRSKIKNEEDSAEMNDEGYPITSEKIFSFIEKIAEKNGRIENLIPKKEYFLGVLDGFSQEQKSAAYDMVEIIDSLPEKPSEDEIATMMQSLSDLETQYGKEFIDTINARLNELSDEINFNETSEVKNSIAV